MLVYKAQQVIAATREDPKDWNFNGKTGTTHSARLACLGSDGNVATIKLKAKTEKELNEKVSRYTLGKAGEVPIHEIVPVFRQGDRKPSAYEYVG